MNYNITKEDILQRLDVEAVAKDSHHQPSILSNGYGYVEMEAELFAEIEIAKNLKLRI